MRRARGPDRGASGVVILGVLAALTSAPASAQDDDEEDVYDATAEVAPPDTGGRSEVDREEVERIPGAVGDPFRLVESMPGALALRSGLAYVYVRGAPPSGTQYFYDDIPIPLLSHLAVGQSAIHPAATREVRFFPGAAPARYGRGIGGVVELLAAEHTADARGEIELRLVDASGFVDVPVERAHAMVALRYGYPGPIVSAFTPGLTLQYGDYLARGRVALSGSDRVEVVALGSVDALDNPPYVDPPSERGDMFLSFHRFELRLVRSLARTEIGFALRAGHDDTRLAEDLAVEAFTLTPRIWAEHEPARRVRFRIGADLAGSTGEITDPDGRLEGPFGEISVDLPLYAGVRTRSAGGAYVELGIRATERVQLDLGVRGDAFIAGGDPQWSVDPRGRLTWRFLERARAHVGVGLAHQPAVYLFPVPGLTETAIDRGLQQAVQADLGVAFEPIETLEVELQGFFHHYDQLLLPDDIWGWDRECVTPMPPFLPPTRPPCTGDEAPPRTTAFAWGGELFVRRRLAEDLTGWLAYTLGWAQAIDADGRSFSPPFDVRHVLNLVLSYSFDVGLYAGARFHLRSGAPAVALQYVAPDGIVLREERLPPFARLDLRAGYAWDAGWAKLDLYIEWFNLWAAEEPIDVSCPGDPTIPCNVVYSPAVFFPSAGLRATFD